jgi:hypothetical protein
LNITLIQNFKEIISDDNKKQLLVSNSIGRNNFNEFVEKMFYHFINPDATSDPKTEDFERIHSLEFETIQNKVNKFRSTFMVMAEVVKEYTDKNGKFWGSCCLRDVLTFVNSLQSKGEFGTISQYREYLMSTLDTIQSTYIKNNKFDAYKNNVLDEVDSEINEFWYRGFFVFFGKGQDGKFVYRRNFLNNNKDKFGSVGESDGQRLFNLFQKQFKYIEQNRKCCGLNGQECKHTNGELSITEMQADHILEHSMNGTTTIDNLQMLCVDCHKEKTKKFMTKQLEVVE